MTKIKTEIRKNGKLKREEITATESWFFEHFNKLGKTFSQTDQEKEEMSPTPRWEREQCRTSYRSKVVERAIFKQHYTNNLNSHVS